MSSLLPLNEDMDAQRWEKEFNGALAAKGIQPIDPGWIISWFANAIMCGYDTAIRRAALAPSLLRECRERIADAIQGGHDTPLMRETFRQCDAALASGQSSALAIVNAQAEDDGLWFVAQTAPEAYLQKELRRLHAAIEASGDEVERLREERRIADMLLLCGEAEGDGLSGATKLRALIDALIINKREVEQLKARLKDAEAALREAEYQLVGSVTGDNWAKKHAAAIARSTKA